jgi:hypothetical protein
MSSAVDLQARRRLRAIRRLTRGCPRVWISELGLWLYALRFFNGPSDRGAA